MQIMDYKTVVDPSVVSYCVQHQNSPPLFTIHAKMSPTSLSYYISVLFLLIALAVSPVDVCSAQSPEKKLRDRELKIDYHNVNEGTQQTGGLHFFAVNFGAIKSSLVALMIFAAFAGLIIYLTFLCRRKIKRMSRNRFPDWSMPSMPSMPSMSNWSWNPQMPQMPQFQWPPQLAFWNRNQMPMMPQPPQQLALQQQAPMALQAPNQAPAAPMPPAYVPEYKPPLPAGI